MAKAAASAGSGGHLAGAHLPPGGKCQGACADRRGVDDQPGRHSTAGLVGGGGGPHHGPSPRRKGQPPVVDDADQLVGIVVSRAATAARFLRRDLTICEEITAEVLTRTLGLDPASVTVRVTGGRATLSGIVPHSSLIPVAVRLCESVDGVIDVTNHLNYAVDDTGSTPRP